MGKLTQIDRAAQKFYDLLELSTLNDLINFRIAIEEEGHDIDEPSLWYERRIGTKKMGCEASTIDSTAWSKPAPSFNNSVGDLTPN
ncbi:hypothetical protein GOBAR_DD24377 [Gossypium barbadense]|nr:hypothetical protein GOBAR_DD24377 [Gossypium barbadense]